MNNHEENHNLWPESSHKPLFKATFLSGAAALTAWEEWKEKVNLDDHPDPGSYSLLSHLYRNLRALNVDDPIMMRLRGIVRKNWVNNQLVLSSERVPVHALRDQGIDVLLLPGAATALQYHSDYVLQPAAEFSLLVHPHAAQAAIRHLQASGWTTKKHLAPEEIEATVFARSYLQMWDGDALHLRLFWRTMPGVCADEIDGSLWTGAASAQLQDDPVWVLNPTDHILWACSPHAAGSLYVRAGEAMLVLQAVPADIDWSRLVTQAQLRWQRVPLLEVLHYLQDTLDNPFPADTLSRLQNTPLFRSEQRAYNFNYREAKGWRKGVALWFEHSQCTPEHHWMSRIVTFPNYLQKKWRLKSIRQVPWHAFLTLLRKLSLFLPAGQ